jgi:hypothetical protein
MIPMIQTDEITPQMDVTIEPDLAKSHLIIPREKVNEWFDSLVSPPLTEKGRHLVACFRSSMIPPASPLSTLRYDPWRDHRQTRGQNGVASPFL